MVINYGGKTEPERLKRKQETEFKMLNIFDFSECRLVTLNQKDVR